jgi:hypothetical protein
MMIHKNIVAIEFVKHFTSKLKESMHIKIKTNESPFTLGQHKKGIKVQTFRVS